MELTFAPRDILQIDDARIVSRNFSGKPGDYNREGDRNFAVTFSDRELADELVARGWNITVKPGKKEGEPERMYLKVKVKFNEKGPNCYLISGNRKVLLNEDTVGRLDDIDIRRVDLDIRPYDWVVNGKPGRTAYLQCIRVVQEIDRFEAADQEEYGDDE